MSAIFAMLYTAKAEDRAEVKTVDLFPRVQCCKRRQSWPPSRGPRGWWPCRPTWTRAPLPQAAVGGACQPDSNASLAPELTTLAAWAERVVAQRPTWTRVPPPQVIVGGACQHDGAAINGVGADHFRRMGREGGGREGHQGNACRRHMRQWGERATTIVSNRWRQSRPPSPPGPRGWWRNGRRGHACRRQR